MASDAPTAAPAPVSRPREVSALDEEASEQLKLGEFTGVPTLSLSEARLVIDKVLRVRKQERRVFQETETLTKMQTYLDHFARFKQQTAATNVERTLSNYPEMEKFEKSQLATLCCEDAQEAKTLIPSLQNKISDEDLTQLLKEIAQNRSLGEA